jgi:hypothetical protein
MSTIKSILIGLFVLACASLWVLVSNKNIYGTDPFDQSAARKTIEDVIRRRGGQAGKEYFLTAYSGLDPGTLHELEHILGAEIYREEGIQGIRFCDDAHLFGCYHGFVATAVALGNPDEVIPAMERVCLMQMTPLSVGGCFHGVGHGLLAHSGYRQEDLFEVLKQCRRLQLRASRDGCYSGAFMEHNTQTMQTGLPAPTVDADAPTVMCDTLETEYRPMCYGELPGLWQRVFGDDVQLMGELCVRAPADGQQPCFSGIGQLVAGMSRFDEVKAREACLRLPSQQGVHLCLEKSREQIGLSAP